MLVTSYPNTEYAIEKRCYIFAIVRIHVKQWNIEEIVQ